jgi:cobalt-zinc-cadmium efflux system outer membrane protein
LGFFVDQVIKTGGKLKLQAAAAKMNLIAAELALKRARSDLSTTIRGDYYSLLVAKETVRVNKGLAHFTDEIFRLQADLLEGGFAASHEPAACGHRPSPFAWPTSNPLPTTSMPGSSSSRTWA